MSLVKIAVLDMNDNHANEGMRCILQIIRNVQGNDHVELAFDVFNVRANNEIPSLDYDVYVSSGGPGSPLPSDEAWEQPYFDLMDQIFDWNRWNERKKFLFLICHSYQLVVRHLGLGTVSERRSTSFGIFPMHKLDAGLDEPLFKQLPDPFYAVDSRNFQITQPDEDRLQEFGAQALCLEKDRPNVPLERAVMAIRFSDEVFGTQFHPEADDEGMLRHFLTDIKRNQIIENFGREKYDAMVAYLQDPDKIALTGSVILPTFLRNAIKALQQEPALVR
ncbi:type 1 glutamine amidotransferase [Spirosoma pomorum]